MREHGEKLISHVNRYLQMAEQGFSKSGFAVYI